MPWVVTVTKKSCEGEKKTKKNPVNFVSLFRAAAVGGTVLLASVSVTSQK